MGKSKDSKEYRDWVLSKVAKTIANETHLLTSFEEDDTKELFIKHLDNELISYKQLKVLLDCVQVVHDKRLEKYIQALINNTK